MGSLGYGYHYVHLQRGTKIKHLEIDENFLRKASTPSNVKINYGGETGGKKRVNTMQGETVATRHQGDSTEIADDS